MIRKQFNPNSCNQGGKQQIDTLQEKHILALINSRPQVVIKPPHPHVDSNKPFSIKDKQDFTEINETYRRVQSLKSGYSDTKMPKTFNMKEQLKKKNKVSQFIQEQVQEFINQRIIQITSKHQKIIFKKYLQELKKIFKELNLIQKCTAQPHLLKTIQEQVKENGKRSPLILWNMNGTKKRPDSVFSKSKLSKGDTLLSNAFSFDQSSYKIQTQSKRNQQDGPFDHADIHINEEIQDEDFFIYTDTQKIPNENIIQSPHCAIVDKKTKSTTNVIIPLVRPNEKMNDVKRKIYQTLMEYKLFQRDQVYQIGLAYINKNQWLDENEILQECNRISKQLYGVE